MKRKQAKDVKARVRFYDTKEGGRKGALPLVELRCPMMIDEELFDCLLVLPKSKQIVPGDTAIVSVEFLSPHIVIPMLYVGKKFNLWEGGLIAEGEITTIGD